MKPKKCFVYQIVSMAYFCVIVVLDIRLFFFIKNNFSNNLILMIFEFLGTDFTKNNWKYCSYKNYELFESYNSTVHI